MMKKQVNGGEPLRVFVGTSAGGEDAEACAVLEAGLRRRATVPLEVEWLRLSRDASSPCGGWRTERWGTPWTALRWAVPAICGWRGRAAYFDCPTLALGDASELAHAAFPRGAFLLARRASRSILTGCLVFDCAEARGRLPTLSEMKHNVGTHQEVGGLLMQRPGLVGDLPEGWGRDDRDFGHAPTAPTASVTFVAAQTQPHGPAADARLAREGRSHWFSGVRLPHYSARLLELWAGEVVAATSEGFSPDAYVPGEPWGPYAIGADRADPRREA